MKLMTSVYNLENFKQSDKYQQKIDYAQKFAKKEASSPNVESYAFVDIYSQSYLNAYEEKRSKIKGFDTIKNAVSGCFALIGAFIVIKVLSVKKKF